MRLMSYNIEWFDECFEDDNTLKTTADATKKLDAVANVLSNVDPDIIGVTEAPNTTTTTGQRDTVAALKNFAQAKGLRQAEAMLGFPSAGRQEIAIMFDPTVASVTHDPGGSAGHKTRAPFDEPFQADSDGDGIPEIYKHFRPPLEAKIERADGGNTFWMIVAHAKSKGIFSAMDRVHFDRTSARNRRKLFAECSSIRHRVDEWLKAGRPTVVMGDINDGPGFDYYESRFGRSAVELILGDVFDLDGMLRYPIGRPKFGRFGWEPSTARFTDTYTGDKVNALIDHIMLSRHFSLSSGSAALVWNPFQLDNAKPHKQALLDASDHFPVTVEID
mmetsp:Transcript_22883/g.38306  ORF Transcript_22883/g.38306 Transcript_22883/m.38306 type:complete len:332 (-) Transcript_22883:6024-7019(-)